MNKKIVLEPSSSEEIVSKPKLIILEEEPEIVLQKPVIETIVMEEPSVEKKKRKPRADIGVKREKAKKMIIKIEE